MSICGFKSSLRPLRLCGLKRLDVQVGFEAEEVLVFLEDRLDVVGEETAGLLRSEADEVGGAEYVLEAVPDRGEQFVFAYSVD